MVHDNGAHGPDEVATTSRRASAQTQTASAQTASAGDVLVGLAAVGQERVLAATRPLNRAVAATGPVLDRLTNSPGLGTLRRYAERTRVELGERGADERARGAARVRATAEGAVVSAAGSESLARTLDEVLPAVLDAVLPAVLDAALPPVLDRLAQEPGLLVPMVDAVISPVLDSVLPMVLDRLADDPALLVPLVDAVIEPVLPDVIERLGQDPDLLVALVERLLAPILEVAIPQALAQLGEDPAPVRELVLGQSTTIAGEVAAVGRSRAVTADDLVERVARRLTLRRPRPARPSLSAEPSLPPGPPALSAPVNVDQAPAEVGETSTGEPPRASATVGDRAPAPATSTPERS